jgi:inorganic pyrophosphatase
MPSLLRLPASPEEGIIHVVVDPALGAFTLSRPLPLGMSYPHDWGFVPGTRAADGDPLDALVLSEGTTYPGLVLRAVPIALVTLEQDAKSKKGRERNDRVVAVPETAPRNEYRSPDDVPARVRQEIERFFIDVTFFEEKHARVLGWEGPDRALAAVARARRKR